MKRSPIAPMSAKRRAALPARAEVRETVLERDEYRCQFWTRVYASGKPVPLDAPIACGGPLDVHEIIPRSAWPDGWLVVDNCVTLCRRAHEWVTDNPAAAAVYGLHDFSWNRP